MPKIIKVPSLTMVDFEGDKLEISCMHNSETSLLIWIDTDKSSLVFTNREELRKLAHFILENI